MTFVLHAVPCLSDNYAYLIHDPDTSVTACVDVPEAAPILAALQAKGWALDHILITHHHADHIDGVADLVAATGAQVWGAAADAHRLPPLDHALAEGDVVQIGGQSGHVIDVSGHTIGHIAFHFPQSALCFTADSLMALGCGRLFEGTPAQMWDSLMKLMALPEDTLICSGHDYLGGNGAFALSLTPEDTALRARLEQVAQNRMTSTPQAICALSLELATNPFLRAADPAYRAAVGLADMTAVQAFAALRAGKDKF
ncbi:MAG: hydroxyacylglutathione hydrolase [Roseinatronobacter sp.]